MAAQRELALAHRSELPAEASAVSKTDTRPDFGQLVRRSCSDRHLRLPGGIGTHNNPDPASAATRSCSPFTSWNYDAALEYYFARTGFASLTVFHRDVNGFITNEQFRFTDPTLGVVQITGPVNTGKGHITGAEFQAQTFFDFGWLPDFARGFGVQANVTYLDAKTQQDNGPGGFAYLPITDQLNGVSRWHYNLVGMYEHYGFSARLTYNGRSSFAATRQYRGDDIYLETGASGGPARPVAQLQCATDNLTSSATGPTSRGSPFRQDFSSARRARRAPNMCATCATTRAPLARPPFQVRRDLREPGRTSACRR